MLLQAAPKVRMLNQSCGAMPCVCTGRSSLPSRLVAESCFQARAKYGGWMCGQALCALGSAAWSNVDELLTPDLARGVRTKKHMRERASALVSDLYMQGPVLGSLISI